MQISTKEMLLRSAVARLEQENRKLREALEWYASSRTWNQWAPESFADRAREALAEAVAIK
jgi:hypothetical protein